MSRLENLEYVEFPTLKKKRKVVKEQYESWRSKKQLLEKGGPKDEIHKIDRILREAEKIICLISHREFRTSE